MITYKKHFPLIIQDNDTLYLKYLEGVLDSVDELCLMVVTKNINSYLFRITPSLPKYIPSLLEEILKINNFFNLELSLGKSIKTSSVITFEITINK